MGLALRDAPAGKAKLMPRVGFGTCCRWSASGAPLIKSTLSYFAQGGRLIDTAQMYGNHQDLRTAIERSGVPREELWVTSKVMTVRGSAKSTEAVATQITTILDELGLQYLDLLLLHHAKNNSPAQRAEQWQALVASRNAGKIRHIGVANYDRLQIEALEAATGVRPAVNQIEYHPYVEADTHALVKWCQASGIAVTAYGSLGSANLRNARKAPPKVAEAPPGTYGSGVAAVATRHGVTPTALLLRWALNHGCAVIPGATSAEHIGQNLNVKRFELSAEDEAELVGSAKPHSWRLWGNMASDRR